MLECYTHITHILFLLVLFPGHFFLYIYKLCQNFSALAYIVLLYAMCFMYYFIINLII